MRKMNEFRPQEVLRRAWGNVREIHECRADSGARSSRAGSGDGERVIDRYQEIWLFGFQTEGAGTVLQPGEVEALSEWMDSGGGVFATGDHETLGASMCSGVPRVRQMRRWTVADGVPPVDSVDRLDTNRPANDAEATGTVPMQFAHEGDATPQRITWIPMARRYEGLWRRDYPHEVLCHPTHGPIDVMPDHPHEGRTRTPDEMALNESYPAGKDEFPNASGTRTLAVVIATGITVPDPPTDKAYKGEAGEFRFPMITVYDGQEENVGRVAVDSTWHHWFDLNLESLEVEDGEEWAKISRYFQNLADWLAPHGHCLLDYLVQLPYQYPLVEEAATQRIDSVSHLGPLVRHAVRREFGPCSARRFAFDPAGHPPGD